MVVTTTVNAKEIILGAKNLLLTDGWITGKYICGSGERCAVGALRAAGGGVHPNQFGYDVFSGDEFITCPHTNQYELAANTLADLVSPGWREYWDDGYPPDLGDVEDQIIGFNDTQSKRDYVIEKFDEAAALL